MKPLLSIILFFLSLLASGQNYQLFNVNTKKVFSTLDEQSKTFSLLFDSVTVKSSSAVYYPYKTVGDIGYISDTCHVWGQYCYHQDRPSWMGSEVQIADDVYNFITNNGSVVSMNFSLAPLQAHVFYEDDLQRFSISRISPGADTMSIIGVIDSVYRYQISHTDLQGNFINSELNTWEIVIGKQLELISFFRIDSFPQVLEPLILLGNESPDAGFYELTNERIFDYLPGDVIQWYDFFYWPLYPELSYRNYFTDSFIERHETSDSLKYKVIREIYIPDSSSLTVDTTWLKYRKDEVIANIPFDWIGSGVLRTGSLSKTDYCGLDLWTFNYWDGHLEYCSEENSWCEFDEFGFTSTSKAYVEGIGLYEYHSGVFGPPTNSSSGSGINYFNKQGVECGEKVVGIFDHPDINYPLVVLPNPANEFFIVSYKPSNKLQDVRLQVIDISGRTSIDINNYNSGSLIDISKLPGGLYLVQLIDGRNAMNGKLIVK